MGTVWILSLLFSTNYFLPHGDLHEQILALSKSIDQYPDSTNLYLERGELYLLHEEPEGALSDFTTCFREGLLNQRVYLGLSKSLLYLEQPDSALHYVNLALRFDQDHPASLETKASILTRLSRFCESAELYTRLITLARQPSPSLYLDASYAWLNCQEDASTGNASKVLIEGMARMGRLHVLEKELVRVYLHEQRYDLALKVQTEIIQHWDHKTKPYFDRAEIYLLLGDKASAIDDLHNALLAIDNMPAHKSSTPAIRTLRNKITSLLNQLEG